MIFCAAGDIHGALDRFYAELLTFEQALGVTFDWVLQVGDFGIWPNPDRIDTASRHHQGAGDFPTWFAEHRAVPRPTVFIKGNHEDFVWLEQQPTVELLPGLHHLRNGEARKLTTGVEVLRVGGVGGCYGPSDFERSSRRLQGYAKRHYTRDQVERLVAGGDLDILLTHDAPAGVRFEHHRHGPGFVSDAAGLDWILAHTKPRVCFFGHHHTRLDSEVAGVPCLGLNKITRPGNLVAFGMSAGERAWRVLGQWP